MKGPAWRPKTFLPRQALSGPTGDVESVESVNPSSVVAAADRQQVLKLVGASASQAAAFYLCAYYAGSSVFGNLGSTAWEAAGWPAVSSLALVLMFAATGMTRTLRRTPALAPHSLPT